MRAVTAGSPDPGCALCYPCRRPLATEPGEPGNVLRGLWGDPEGRVGLKTLSDTTAPQRGLTAWSDRGGTAAVLPPALWAPVGSGSNPVTSPVNQEQSWGKRQHSCTTGGKHRLSHKCAGKNKSAASRYATSSCDRWQNAQLEV